MTEEAAAEEAAAAPPTTNAKSKNAAPKTNGETATAAAAAGAGATDGDKGKRKFNKRDETPIEELFDLSQPIPKVRFSLQFDIYIYLMHYCDLNETARIYSLVAEIENGNIFVMPCWDTLYLRLLVDSLCTDPTLFLLVYCFTGG